MHFGGLTPFSAYNIIKGLRGPPPSKWRPTLYWGPCGLTGHSARRDDKHEDKDEEKNENDDKDKAEDEDEDNN